LPPVGLLLRKLTISIAKEYLAEPRLKNTAQGVCEKLTGGMQNFKNHSKQVYLGRIFITNLIWGVGYAEGYNPD
jgi:hypothetical protein